MTILKSTMDDFWLSENLELFNISDDNTTLEIQNDILCCDEKYVSEIEGFCICINCGVAEKNKQIYDENIYGFQNGKDSIFLHSISSGLYPQSSNGTSIAGNSRMAKINKWNNMPYKERVIWEMSNELNTRLSGILSEKIISETIYQYKYIYNKTNIHRGKNKKGLVASCVYFAANNNNTKISPKTVADLMNTDISTVNKYISIYTEHLKLDTNISKARDYAQQYCNKYSIVFKIQKLLINFCDVVEDSDILQGSVPQNICLSCLFFILHEMKQENITLKKICEDYNVSTNTIHKILEILSKNKNYIFSRLK